MQTVIQEIMQEPAVRLSFLSSNILAHKILDHAHAVIKGLPPQCQFKIGQTVHPVHRWQNPAYGYKVSRCPIWSIMKVVAVLAHGESAGFLEAALISAWSSHPACVNEAGGGEAVSKQLQGPFFVYVVVSLV